MSWNPDDLSGFSLPGYQLIRQLGQGGMATVYLALQESVEREVALKVMSPFLASDRSFTSRFLREARIAAQLHHPHIVTVHDVGVHETYHYIAMQYLSGGKLSDLDLQTLPVQRALEIVRDIAEALSYAHEKGFVHRDVKPDNILFNEKGASCLTDFGIARAADSNTQMTATGSIIGTPHYMSPEQARGRKVDHRADLYSLGIVLYELLVGEVPYQSEESLTVCIMHVNDPLPRLPQCLSPLQPVLDRLLAKDPADRYEHAQALLDALSVLQVDQGLKACLEFTPATLPHVVDDTTRKNTPEIRPTPRPETRRSVQTLSENQSSPRTWVFWMIPLVLVLASTGWFLYDRWEQQQETVREEARLAQQLARLSWLVEQGRFARPADENAVSLLRSLRASHPDNPRMRDAASRMLEAWLNALEQQPTAAELSAWQQLATDLGLLSGTLQLRQEQLEKQLSRGGEMDEHPEETNSRSEAATSVESDWRGVVEALLQDDDMNSQLRAWALLQQAPPGMALEHVDALRQQAVDQIRQKMQRLLDANDLNQLHLRLARLNEFPDLYRQLDGAWWQDELHAREQARSSGNLLAERIRQLLDEGSQFLAQTQLTRPPGANAQERFEQVLALDPDNKSAQKGLMEVLNNLLQLAEKSMKAGDIARASRYLTSAEGLHIASAELQQARTRLEHMQSASPSKTASKAEKPAELPTDETALLAFAEQQKRTNPDLAIQAWHKVLEINPSSIEAEDALSRTARALALDVEFLLEQNEMDEARKRMQWAMLADPDHPEVKAIRRKFKRASKKLEIGRENDLTQLKNIAMEQRLLKQAQMVAFPAEAQSLWEQADSAGMGGQQHGKIRKTLLKTAVRRVRSALTDANLDEADQWLKWLEDREQGRNLAAPLRLEWRELQNQVAEPASDTRL